MGMAAASAAQSRRGGRVAGARRTRLVEVLDVAEVFAGVVVLAAAADDVADAAVLRAGAAVGRAAARGGPGGSFAPFVGGSAAEEAAASAVFDRLVSLRGCFPKNLTKEVMLLLRIPTHYIGPRPASRHR
jgi:hypothetical protein